MMVDEPKTYINEPEKYVNDFKWRLDRHKQTLGPGYKQGVRLVEIAFVQAKQATALEIRQDAKGDDKRSIERSLTYTGKLTSKMFDMLGPVLRAKGLVGKSGFDLIEPELAYQDAESVGILDQLCYQLAQSSAGSINNCRKLIKNHNNPLRITYKIREIKGHLGHIADSGKQIADYIVANRSSLSNEGGKSQVSRQDHLVQLLKQFTKQDLARASFADLQWIIKQMVEIINHTYDPKTNKQLDKQARSLLKNAVNAVAHHIESSQPLGESREYLYYTAINSVSVLDDLKDNNLRQQYLNKFLHDGLRSNKRLTRLLNSSADVTAHFITTLNNKPSLQEDYWDKEARLQKLYRQPAITRLCKQGRLGKLKDSIKNKVEAPKKREKIFTRLLSTKAKQASHFVNSQTTLQRLISVHHDVANTDAGDIANSIISSINSFAHCQSQKMTTSQRYLERILKPSMWKKVMTLGLAGHKTQAVSKLMSEPVQAIKVINSLGQINNSKLRQDYLKQLVNARQLPHIIAGIDDYGVDELTNLISNLANLKDVLTTGQMEVLHRNLSRHSQFDEAVKQSIYQAKNKETIHNIQYCVNQILTIYGGDFPEFSNLENKYKPFLDAFSDLCDSKDIASFLYNFEQSSNYFYHINREEDFYRYITNNQTIQNLWNQLQTPLFKNDKLWIEFRVNMICMKYHEVYHDNTQLAQQSQDLLSKLRSIGVQSPLKMLGQIHEYVYHQFTNEATYKLYAQTVEWLLDQAQQQKSSQEALDPSISDSSQAWRLYMPSSIEHNLPQTSLNYLTGIARDERLRQNIFLNGKHITEGPANITEAAQQTKDKITEYLNTVFSLADKCAQTFDQNEMNLQDQLKGFIKQIMRQDDINQYVGACELSRIIKAKLPPKLVKELSESLSEEYQKAVNLLNEVWQAAQSVRSSYPLDNFIKKLQTIMGQNPNEEQQIDDDSLIDNLNVNNVGDLRDSLECALYTDNKQTSADQHSDDVTNLINQVDKLAEHICEVGDSQVFLLNKQGLWSHDSSKENNQQSPSDEPSDGDLPKYS